jgi:putative transposase
MRPSKFTEAQIVAALRQVSDRGMPAVQVCRSMGITQTTFYRWRKKHGGMLAGGARELRELREENAELKQIVANLLLEKKRGGDAGRRSC